jgi:hypothetical protein
LTPEFSTECSSYLTEHGITTGASPTNFYFKSSGASCLISLAFCYKFDGAETSNFNLGADAESLIISD